MKTPNTVRRSLLWTSFILVTAILFQCKTKEQTYTRGIGVYPGKASESAAPELKPAGNDYRNLALLRQAFHSSSYDYNLTAQLITDGIIEKTLPSILTVTTSRGTISKNEREYPFDHNRVTTVSIPGVSFIQIQLGGTIPGNINALSIVGELGYDPAIRSNWSYVVKGSNDGNDWKQIGQLSGKGVPGVERYNYFSTLINNPPKDSTGKPIDPMVDYLGPDEPGEPKPSFTNSYSGPHHLRSISDEIRLDAPADYRYYRIEFNAPQVLEWSIGDITFLNSGKQVELAPSHYFNSSWMSGEAGDQWVYVDLGTVCEFDLVKLHWLRRPATGELQVSDNGNTWQTVAALKAGENAAEEISINKNQKARFVRVLMNGGSEPYILTEVEIMGRGGLIAEPIPQPDPEGNILFLTGGNWQIQRASLVDSDGEKLSVAGAGAPGWVPATVPGTALVSYINAGVLPDPNTGDNQVMISESFFNSDFWYRNEFTVPGDFTGEKVFLNFNGINWKADIFLNGKKLGNINGAFIRGRFDATELIEPGKINTLAVLIHKNANIGCVTEQTIKTPDKNGGILGADNPTFHASIGWDWIPTIRGRNIGIWNDVFLTTTGAVTIENPFVSTDLPLPDTTTAEVTFNVPLKNHLASEVTGTLSAAFGDITVDEKLTLKANEERIVTLTVSDYPQLKLTNPKLWWPKGYGAPHLYDVKIRFLNGDEVSDQKEFKSGVREMHATETNMVLDLYVNGRRFIGRGGNWGFAESNLNYRGREYDAAVKYHADMNFTMIRNWVGQIGDEEFYEACDRHGIMVWQDFWLANPWDGPDPEDNKMFIENAHDLILKIRNHPSIAIYVGRNEGNPLPPLDSALRAQVKSQHPGIHYISNSAGSVVSGGGPYRALPVKDYFLLYGRHKFHSERGMPNVMTIESIRRMLPESKVWPQNDQWGLHDYAMEGAQGAASFNKIIETAFGPIDSPERFTELAQWINYDGYRGMFEGRSRFRKGLLLWMSHSAWPSMVWQTYDYYLEPTAAYFGTKKACEAIHIQWNPVWDKVELVNNYGGDMTGLTAEAKIYNMDGTVQWKKDTTLNSKDDTTERLFKLDFSEKLSATHFIKLTLKRGTTVISENFYWRAHEPGNYQALNTLRKVSVTTKTTVTKTGGEYKLETVLENNTNAPALMIRLKVIGTESGGQILPALYSDNYIFLMPGDSKTIKMSVQDEDTRGEKPGVVVSGFNLN